KSVFHAQWPEKALCHEIIKSLAGCHLDDSAKDGHSEVGVIPGGARLKEQIHAQGARGDRFRTRSRSRPTAPGARFSESRGMRHQIEYCNRAPGRFQLAVKAVSRSACIDANSFEFR